MSLLFLEGFDHYGGGSTFNVECQGKWTGVIGNNEVITAPGRDLESSITMGNQNDQTSDPYLISRIMPSADSELVIGMAIYHTGVGATSQYERNIFRIQDVMGNVFGTIGFRASLVPGYWLNHYTVNDPVAAANASIPANMWNYLEVRILFSNSVGEVEWWLNDVQIGSTTGIDTIYQGDLSFGGFQLRFGNTFAQITQLRSTGIPSARFDDIYVVDTLGSAPWNGRLGDQKLHILRATANGGVNDMTATGAASNYEAIEDSSGPDEDSSYVESDVLNDQELYEFDNLPTVDSVIAVQPVVRCRKVAAGIGDMEIIHQDAGGVNNGTTKGIPGDYVYHHEIFEQNPDTASAWTPSEVDASEFGFENV